MPATHRHGAGFTLSELLTAVVVVAVLAAIAVPTWRKHLLRARRADATAALITLQTAQDQYFARNARYADAAQLAGKPPQGLGLNEISERGFYRIEMRTLPDGLGYTATARPVPLAGQADDARCAQFTMNHNGIRGAVDAEGNDRTADCWR